MRRHLPLVLIVLALVAVAAIIIWSPALSPDGDDPSHPGTSGNGRSGPGTSGTDGDGNSPGSSPDPDGRRTGPGVSAVDPGAEDPDIWQSRVWGTVTDSDGAPLAEAVVTMVDVAVGIGETLEIAQTNFDGVYEIRDPHRHWEDEDRINLALAAVAPGRGRLLRQLEINRVAPEARIDFSLPAGAAIAGRVIWAGGEPVRDADMIAYTWGVDRGVDSTFSTGQSDGAGLFRLESLSAAEPRISISVAPPGERYQSGGVFSVGDEDVTVVLQPRIGVVTGQVIWHGSGEPNPNCTVWLGDHLSGWDAWVTSADEEGRFRFEEIPLEQWKVQVPEFPDDDVTLNLNEREPEQDITIRLGAALSIEGIAVDTDTGNPVPFLRLQSRTEPRRGPWTSTPTDGSGRFHITLNPETDEIDAQARFRIDEDGWFFGDGSKNTEVSVRGVRGGIRPIHLEVRRGHPLVITALTEDEEPIPSAPLSLLRGPGTEPRLLGMTDPEGRLVTEIARAPETVQIWGQTDARPLILSEWFSSDAEEVVAEAVPTVELEVHVLDIEGEHIPEVAVGTRSRAAVLGDSESLQIARAGRTDAEGIWRGLAVPAVETFLIARLERGDSGLFPTASKTINLTGQHGTVRVDLQFEEIETFPLEGVVVDGAQNTPIPGATITWAARDIDGQPQTGGPLTSDAEGMFEITMDLNQLWLEVTVVAAGYQDRTIEYSVPELPFLRFEMAQLSTVIGTVPEIAPENSGLTWFLLWQEAGAEWGTRWSLEEIVNGSEIMDESSGFAWGVEPERLGINNLLMVIGPEERVAAVEFVANPAIPGESIDVGALALEEGLPTSGRVLTFSEEPIPGAIVDFETSPALSVHPEFPHAFIALTGTDGQFELMPLPSGTWNLRMGATGYVTIAPEISLPGAVDEVYHLEPIEGVTATVQILDSGGEPADSATVRLWDARGGEDFEARDPLAWGEERTTDSDGRVVFDRVAAPDCQLQFDLNKGDEQVTHRRGVHVSEQGLDVLIDISSWTDVTGLTIVSGDIHRNTLVMLSGDSEEMASHTESASFSNESGGAFHVRVPAGDYVVTVHLPDPEQHTEVIHIEGDEGRFDLILRILSL